MATTRSKRMKALEAELAWRQGGSPGDANRNDCKDSEAIIRECERDARLGYFDAEPDFPKAFGLFRDVVANGLLQAFDEGRRDQVEESKLLEAAEAYLWLAEIVLRVARGIPSVTEAEFEELAKWFRENESWLKERATRGRAKRLSLGKGKTTTVESLRCRIKLGVRNIGAGLLAVELRYLRGE